MRTIRKNKNYAHRRTYKGGKLPILTTELAKFRNRLINHWGKTDWKLKPKIKQIDIENQETHHPVIINLLQQSKQYQLQKNNIIWNLYYGKTKFGKPEYDFAMDVINRYCENDRNCQSMDVCNVIPEIIKELYKSSPFNNVNILQPSLWQIFVLQYFIEKSRYKYMNELQNSNLSTDEKWYMYLQLFYDRDIKNRFYFVDLDLLGSGHDNDLEERAHIVANRILNNENINSVYTMDGHGRFITRMVSKILDNSPDFFEDNPDFNIFVYELDDEAHMWHKITLPNGSAVNGNMLDELEKSINDDSIEHKLFYCNFSGLQGQGPRIINSYRTIHENNSNIDNLIVSFSSAREGKKPSEKLLNDIAELNDEMVNEILILTRRNDFITIGTNV